MDSICSTLIALGHSIVRISDLNEMMDGNVKERTTIRGRKLQSSLILSA
jgi:hypothetical protein